LSNQYIFIIIPKNSEILANSTSPDDHGMLSV